MCNGQERDPRVKAEHEAQEQKPIRVKENHVISNRQVRYWTGDISNGKEFSNIISEVALIDQDISSTDVETSDRDTYNFIPLSRPENLQFLVKQLPKSFYNIKLASFYF
ncbi:2465_t:CDS:1, partial [Dentiscutata heterogama]